MHVFLHNLIYPAVGAVVFLGHKRNLPLLNLNSVKSQQSTRLVLNSTGASIYDSTSGNEALEENVVVKFLKTWLPFINELAGVLEHSGFKLFKGIYRENTVQRVLIDGLALSSMIWNTADEAAEKDSLTGILKGIGLLIFSFLAPTYLIGPIVERLAKMKFGGHFFNKPIGRLISGAALITVLETCVKIWDDKIIPLLKKGYHKAQKFFAAPSESQH